MAFFSDQRERLLRESWTADALAQELYAMLATDLPVSTSSPLKINPAQPSSQAPLQLKNITDGQQIISLKKSDGSSGGSIVYYQTGPVFVTPGGQSVPLVCCKSTPVGPVETQECGATGTGSATSAFTDPLNTGDLIAIWVESTANFVSSVQPNISIADDAGNVYIPIASIGDNGPYFSGAGSDNAVSTSLWYAIVSATGSPNITVSAVAGTDIVIFDAVNFRKPSGKNFVFNGFSSNKDITTVTSADPTPPSAPFPESFNTGSIPVSGPSLLVAGMYTIPSFDDITAAGWDTHPGSGDGDIASKTSSASQSFAITGNDGSLHVRLGPQNSGGFDNGDGTHSTTFGVFAIGASFKIT